MVVQVAWAWLAFSLTASPVWCSVALRLLWPVHLGNLAGVFRTNPAFRCQVRPREGGRRLEEKVWALLVKSDVGSWHGRDWTLFGPGFGNGSKWLHHTHERLSVLCDQVILFFFRKPPHPKVIWSHWFSTVVNFRKLLYCGIWRSDVFFVCWPLPLGLTERSACRVDQISGAYGWWGERTLFLTSLHSCRTENYVPGLHLLTFQHPRNDSQPDKVWSPDFLC